MSPLTALRVVDAGWSTTIQDVGRIGYGAIGVPRAGPADRRAHEHANRLVGNPTGAAAFETRGGLTIEAVSSIVIAASPDGWCVSLAPGDRVGLRAPERGVWAYLAVRGGVDVAPVLGSRSRDTLAGIGPQTVATGDGYPTGPDPLTSVGVDTGPLRRVEGPVRLWEGPRRDRFVDPLGTLVARPWTVSTAVSRVGVRLERFGFERSGRTPASMPSEGLVEGAIQITPAGEPIIMACDHPTTGGYPVVAVVDPDDMHLVTNAHPGSMLRFRPA